ncbi:tail fiber domain-containing protein [Limosilactobacillus mucosae]|uniref:tail fiber domain-containing protein n=1 Tax=Limosilactobacillus mucosae TaxID=97478 RepID=UPI003C6D82C3
MSNTSTSNDKTVGDDAKVKLIIGEIGRDTKTGIIGRGYSFDNGNTFHVTDTIFGRLYDGRDADGIWNNGMHEKVKEKVNQEITNTVEPAIKQADSAVAYANDAIEKSRVNSQAIEDINSAVSDAVSDAAVARSDGLRAWDAAQSNVDLIDQNYASASAAISSARTEAIAAADEAKASASAAQADIVAVRSDVAAVQVDVTTTQSDVATAKSDIAVAKTNLASQATSLSSYASQASAAGQDITVLKSQAGQFEQDMADTKGDVSQLKVSASSASAALSDAAGNISSLQASAKSYSAALSDTNSNVATVTATASELETKYADAAGDISQIKVDAKGMTQTISNVQGDIAKLKTRADGFDTEFASTNGDISKLQVDASGTKQTLTNAKSDIAVLQSRADGFDTKYSNVAGDINKLQVDASGMKQTLTDAQGNISTLQTTATGFKNTLTDAQGNISTLQSDVAGLKKTTSDHAGNIATLQADAKTLTSQMSSAQGDISTLKQTASGFSSKVSGMETSLANANSKLDGITSNGGGRNLLRNSNVELHGKAYSLGGTPLTIDRLEAGETYTMSWYGKVDANATKHKQPLAVFIYNASWGWASWGTIPYTANEYQRNVFTFTVPKDVTDVDRVEFYLKHYNDDASQYQHDNDSDAGIGYVKDYMLEKGAIAHDWQPAPEDTDAKITTNSAAIDQNKKAIALKADQTTVDKTNVTVQQLQSQLKIQSDQINAKVSSSDLDAKGYATQTYTQTQIKQTADSWNANLTSVENGLTDKYTNLHATVDGIQAQVYNSDGSSRITQLSNLVATKVSSSDFDNLSKAVKLQTLDSADINSMKTNGHYFVHNLANNPISGWVYVDVTGNGNDRIRQDVYQDTGTKHCYRRWYSNRWTAWSQGATESEIVQLSDDINIRVKKGDVVSQINQEAGGNTLIQVSNGKGKLALNASSVVFSGSAFIPDAYISTLNADKLRFYDSSGNVATMSAGLKQYDDDKTKRSIVLQYAGGYEVHASDLLGSILTMHDNTIRLAVKAHGADTGQNDQYSGFYAGSHYAQLSSYRSNGKVPGIFITDDSFTIKGDDSGSGTKYGDLYIASPQIFLNSDTKCQINGVNAQFALANNWSTLYAGNNLWLETKNTQVHLGDNVVDIANKNNSNTSNYDVHLTLRGYVNMTGWLTCMGLTQTSRLSTKTRIEPLDTAKALELINSADVATYQYKQEVAHGGTKRHASVIIDDVHDVAQYQTPDEFISEDRQGRSDGDIVGYLMGAVQELTKKFKTLESKVG